MKPTEHTFAPGCFVPTTRGFCVFSLVAYNTLELKFKQGRLRKISIGTLAFYFCPILFSFEQAHGVCDSREYISYHHQ